MKHCGDRSSVKSTWGALTPPSGLARGAGTAGWGTVQLVALRSLRLAQKVWPVMRDDVHMHPTLPPPPSAVHFGVASAAVLG